MISHASSVRLDRFISLNPPRKIKYQIPFFSEPFTGKTYFFKGEGYWQFDDMRMHVSHDMRKRSARKWMGKDLCKNKEPEKRQQYVTSKRDEEIYDLDERDKEESQDEEDMYFEIDFEKGAFSHASSLRRLNVADFMTISIISLMILYRSTIQQ